jgi:tetratricopeptide (TPR) repeat protein
LAIVGLLGLILAGTSLCGWYIWAAYHLRATRSCLALYHNAEAQLHLEAALRVWPRHPEILLLAARAARRLGATDRAAHLLEMCQDVRGKDDADLFLEQVLLRVENGEMERLRVFCQTLVQDDHPSAPLVLEAMTRTFVRQFRYAEAQECIGRWLDRQPDNTLALYFKAYLDEQRQQLRDAVTGYRGVLERDPDYDEARARLVDLLLQLHTPSDALDEAMALRRRRPDDPRLDVLLARCREQLGQVDEAERLLDGVLARYPQDGQALFERGQLAMRAGQSEAAESWLQQAVTQEPGDYKIRFQYFLCLQRNGKAAEAGAQQRRLDQIRADMEQIQEIVTHKMQADPHNPKLHFEVGLIALRAGAVEEGKRWLRSALKEDPQYAEAHLALALVYERTGEPGLAAHHRRLAEMATPAKTSAP